VLAGPDPDSVTDDPEGQQTLAELRVAWDGLDPQSRRRVHIACLPMRDLDENAAIVNALQRRADIVVQKSLAEGFGLTVAEAMWKARPTIASRVGGIQDQIEPDVSGVLIEPTELQQFGAAIATLLDDPDTAASIGSAGQPGHAVYVAVAGGRVAGVVTVCEQTHFTGQTDAYVGELVVASGRERRGIATALMNAAETWAAGRGLAFRTLQTGAANQPARDLYRQLGYREEDVRLTKAIPARHNHPNTQHPGRAS